jgi:hypothetical protein
MDPTIAQKTYGKADVQKMEEDDVEDWQTKLGKLIFYLTCAIAIWFFYWFAGINCPC